MRISVLRAAAACAAAVAPGQALPCGGFFGANVEVAPSQEIVVVHRAGSETYVFRPHFCGATKDFGVILPIPAALLSSPALADNALFDQLDSLTAPDAVGVCMDRGGIGCGAGAGAPGAGTPPGDVNVVNRGRVGIFDFVLLQATTATAFTDWLDQNGFPRGPGGSDAYDDYVARGWYFVAFRVTADTVPPPAGMKLCGDLGPIQLSFPAGRPIVPARIASVNQGFGAPPTWRVFAIAAAQQRLDGASTAFRPTFFFSGAIRQEDLADRPALGAFAQAGDRLTVLDVGFPLGAVSGDIGLEDAGATTDFRSQVQVHDPARCSGGCAAGREAPLGTLGLLIGAGLLRARRISRA